MSVLMAPAPPIDATDLWLTPRSLLADVERIAPITLDPCASDDPANHFARDSWPRAANGLLSSWIGPAAGIVFVNPPFSRGNLEPWSRKCADEGEAGAEVVLLVPARTGSSWFHEQIFGRAQAGCFMRGRVAFVDPATSKAPGRGRIDTVLAYYGKRWERFAEVFSERGEMWRGNRK